MSKGRLPVSLQHSLPIRLSGEIAPKAVPTDPWYSGLFTRLFQFAPQDVFINYLTGSIAKNQVLRTGEFAAHLESRQGFDNDGREWLDAVSCPCFR
jgi:hypothetical protein